MRQDTGRFTLTSGGLSGPLGPSRSATDSTAASSLVKEALSPVRELSRAGMPLAEGSRPLVGSLLIGCSCAGPDPVGRIVARDVQTLVRSGVDHVVRGRAVGPSLGDGAVAGVELGGGAVGARSVGHVQALARERG